MLFLFQGYYPQEEEVPTTPAVLHRGAGYLKPEIRQKLLYIYKPEDLELLDEEELVALWAFTEIL